MNYRTKPVEINCTDGLQTISYKNTATCLRSCWEGASNSNVYSAGPYTGKDIKSNVYKWKNEQCFEKRPTSLRKKWSSTNLENVRDMNINRIQAPKRESKHLRRYQVKNASVEEIITTRKASDNRLTTFQVRPTNNMEQATVTPNKQYMNANKLSTVIRRTMKCTGKTEPNKKVQRSKTKCREWCAG